MSSCLARYYRYSARLRYSPNVPKSCKKYDKCINYGLQQPENFSRAQYFFGEFTRNSMPRPDNPEMVIVSHHMVYILADSPPGIF
jgi:hypothetical protein